MDAPNQSSPNGSPRLSPSASPSRSRASSRASHLSLDLSCLPPLTAPAQPTNTLLITNLSNLAIFATPHIDQLRTIINTTATLASWSPLKSFRRIVCSFNTTDDAIAVRQALNGESIMGDRVRVYFGEHTPLEPVDQHLHAPESKKLFFISPPPSPPHGWESKDEGPPNTVVVAEDLAHALQKLSWDSKTMVTADELAANHKENETRQQAAVGRSRSGSSVVLFEPEGGSGGGMPAISVDDYTDSGDEGSPVSPTIPNPPEATIRTSRPPVELISEA